MPWLWTSRPCLGSQNPRIGRKQCSMLFFWEGFSELSLLSQQFLLWEAPRPFWVGERGLQGQNYFYNTTGYPFLLSHRCIEEFFRAAWCMMMLYSEHCSKVCVSQWANFIFQWPVHGISQVVLVVKNLPASAGDARDTGSIPESGRPPGVGNGNRLQCSCLGNSMDRGAWWATVHRVTKSGKGLKQLTTHACMYMCRKQVYGSLLYLILKFAVNLKLIWKIEVYFKNALNKL